MRAIERVSDNLQHSTGNWSPVEEEEEEKTKTHKVVRKFCF